ncbi:hypothetical protein SAY86_000086 [Trapa natans]|uniref:Uncharacterized protein n=1 Tax=Trapa natans TaxID=22666 RepID=A0AAN7M3G2_TRANT|nr:hypothetical protein SAY86_000086 [Trapa natans]
MATAEVAGAGTDLPEKEPTGVIKPEEAHEEEPGVEEGEGSWPELEDKYEEKLPEQFIEDVDEEGDIESPPEEEKPIELVEVEEEDEEDEFASDEKENRLVCAD